MLELVFAPAKDWINKSDQDIVDATMEELKKLFPTPVSYTHLTLPTNREV